MMEPNTKEDIPPPHQDKPDDRQDVRDELDESPWEYEAVLSHIEGYVTKLKSNTIPVARCIDDLVHSHDVVEAEEAASLIDWSKVRNFELQMSGYTREGESLKWFKDYWLGKPNQTKTIRKNWKFMMDGIYPALSLMKVGEESWFAVHTKGQSCSYIINYPTLEEDVYVKIKLLAVEDKKIAVPKVNKEASLKPYNPEQQLEKIKTLKKETDKNYLMLKDPSLSLPEYTAISNKCRGMVASLKHNRKDMIPEVNSILRATLSNISLMHMNMQQYDICIEVTDKILKEFGGLSSEDHKKLIMRKAYCYEKLKAFNDALLLYYKLKDVKSITRVNQIVHQNILEFHTNFKKSDPLY